MLLKNQPSKVSLDENLYWENRCWEAVLHRDKKADGTFVFAVSTTGVYCRPSCPARRPKRAHVRFFEDFHAAELAGFRPCTRCLPDRRVQATIPYEAVKAACRLLESSEDMPDLKSLAAKAGYSPYYFHRLFKKMTGVTPKAYGAAHRRARMLHTLKEAPNITKAIFDAGYSSSSRFYEISTDMLGMRPHTYRRGGNQETIYFTVGECSLGSILVAATKKGVCSIAFGNDPHTLLEDLQDSFPYATFVGGDDEFERLVTLVVGLVEDPCRGVDLPLDIRGTAFQQLVWQALRAIPPGTKITYSELAKRIGKPRAARAVAAACAANTLAVAIPCHRVVRKDGSLSGYRWELARKNQLLEKELKKTNGDERVRREKDNQV